jgi:putative ABC transport system ATP-binding protein
MRSTLLGSGRRRGLAAASALLMGHQTGEALVPVTVGVVIDRATETSDGSALVRWLIVLAGVFAMLSYSYRFGARRLTATTQSAAHDLRLRITERALDGRGTDGGDELTGAVLSLATSDASRVSLLCGTVASGCAAFAALAVAGVALVRVSIPLTLLVMLGLPPMLLVMRLLSKPLEQRSEAEQEQAAVASGLAADLVGGLRVLKGLGAERAAAARYRTASRSSLTAAVRAATANAGYEAAGVLVPGVFLAVVALVAGRLAVSGSISVGELVAVLGLAQFLQGPFNMLAWLAMRLAQVRASARRVATFLNTSPAVSGGDGRVDATAQGAVRFEHATLDGLGPVDLTVEAGEMLGVVVDDPVAATTLLGLLARHHDPTDGAVRLDSLDLRTLDPDSLHRVAVVSMHDADLFEGSVLDNVGALASGPDAAAAAISAAGVEELLAALAEGRDSSVGERGLALSGGQRQRVALARALAARSPLLVLHDPTTAIDTVTEAAIAGQLRAVRGAATTVLVTTSPTLLAVCDRVVVLDGGVVGVHGTHHELVAANERYRELVLS